MGPFLVCASFHLDGHVQLPTILHRLPDRKTSEWAPPRLWVHQLSRHLDPWCSNHLPFRWSTDRLNNTKSGQFPRKKSRHLPIGLIFRSESLSFQGGVIYWYATPSVPLLPWMITFRFASWRIPDLTKDKPLNLRSISSQQKKVTFLVIVITSLIFFFRWYVMDMSNQRVQVFPNKPQCSYKLSSPTINPNELPSLAFGKSPRHLLKWTHVPRLVPFRKSHSCGPWSWPFEECWKNVGKMFGKNKKWCSSHLRVIRFQRQKEVNL